MNVLPCTFGSIQPETVKRFASLLFNSESVLFRRKRFQQSTTKTIVSDQEYELKFNVSGGHFMLNEKKLRKLPDTFLGSRK